MNEYDYTIYIDGSIKIIGDINQYINRYSKGASMIGFPHYERDCIYEEAEICKKYKLDKPEIIDEQMSFYKSKGFPEHYGLNACGIMVRSNRDQTLNKVMDDWWYEVNTHSKRDQLSFNYVCWKNNYQFDLCDLYIDLNNYFVNMRTFYRKLNVITYKEISVDYLESNRYAIDEKLKELVKKGKKLAIWGCGEKCKKILKLFDNNNEIDLKVYDRDMTKVGSTINNTHIISDYTKDYSDLIFVSNNEFLTEISEQVKKFQPQAKVITMDSLFKNRY